MLLTCYKLIDTIIIYNQCHWSVMDGCDSLTYWNDAIIETYAYRLTYPLQKETWLFFLYLMEVHYFRNHPGCPNPDYQRFTFRTSRIRVQVETSPCFYDRTIGTPNLQVSETQYLVSFMISKMVMSTTRDTHVCDLTFCSTGWAVEWW